MNVYIYLRFGGKSRLVTENYKKKTTEKNIQFIKKIILLKNSQDICIINQIYIKVLTNIYFSVICCVTIWFYILIIECLNTLLV